MRVWLRGHRYGISRLHCANLVHRHRGCLSVLEGHTASVEAVSFDPEGKHVVTASLMVPCSYGDVGMEDGDLCAPLTSVRK